MKATDTWPQHQGVPSEGEKAELAARLTAALNARATRLALEETTASWQSH